MYTYDWFVLRGHICVLAIVKNRWERLRTDALTGMMVLVCFWRRAPAPWRWRCSVGRRDAGRCKHLEPWCLYNRSISLETPHSRQTSERPDSLRHNLVNYPEHFIRGDTAEEWASYFGCWQSWSDPSGNRRNYTAAETHGSGVKTQKERQKY